MKVSTGFWESLTQPQAVLLAGLIGAFGALFAGLAANALAQLLVFHGQDRRRWEEARRTTYAKMQRAVMAVWDAYDEDGEEWDDDETIALARRNVLDAYVEASLLVRRRRTDKALDDLYDASSYLWSRRGRSWEEVERRLHERNLDFHHAARNELGMPQLPRESFEDYAAVRTGATRDSSTRPSHPGESERQPRTVKDLP